MKVFIVAAVLFASALAAPSISDNKVESEGSMSKMMQYFGNCMESEDVAGCLAVKGITALNRAARASNIKITEGIVLARYKSNSQENSFRYDSYRSSHLDSIMC